MKYGLFGLLLVTGLSQAGRYDADIPARTADARLPDRGRGIIFGPARASR
jgi:hypothetical protein